MSLTSILESDRARAVLKGLIRNPGSRPKPRVRVPRVAASPQRVGTAFDYALRFGLAARYPVHIDHLVAETALARLEGTPSLQEHVGLARRQRDEAAGILRALPRQTALGAKAADACYRLASLDAVWRARNTEQLYQSVSSEEIKELQALYGIVPWDQFQPEQRLILNPTFLIGSRLVGGADADILLDNVVLDVKTIKDQALSVGLVRQLVGYALLANQYGITGLDDRPSFARLGVYFSRAGVLHRFDLAEAIAPSDHDEVLSFLISQDAVYL
jgi:hypothetical protein